MRTYVTDDRVEPTSSRPEPTSSRGGRISDFRNAEGEHGHDLDDWLEAERPVANAT